MRSGCATLLKAVEDLEHWKEFLRGKNYDVEGIVPLCSLEAFDHGDISYLKAEDGYLATVDYKDFKIILGAIEKHGKRDWRTRGETFKTRKAAGVYLLTQARA